MFRDDDPGVIGQVFPPDVQSRSLSWFCRDRDGSKAELRMRGRAVVRGGFVVGMAIAALAGRAEAGDLPVKAPPASAPAAYDWSGFYVGGHIGYAAGTSGWSATSTAAPAPSLTGTVNFFNSLDAFKGTGSYFEGFQAGYNFISPSRFLFGVEADASFPNRVGGTATVASATAGLASYSEQVEYAGTLRGRIGYAPNLGTKGHWLFYATGGLAWTFDQFTRTQIAGGTVSAGTVENLYMVPRLGGTAGVGIEYALPSLWTARLEYLFADFGNRSVTFPAASQRFDSNLDLNELRFGLNYRLNGDSAKQSGDAADAPALETDNFAVHGQTTFLEQYVLPFRSPYLGPNSLDPNQGRETWDATAYLGMRLWQGAEFWVDPELDQGFGLSGTLGVAGFPSGEAYKVGSAVPYARVHPANDRPWRQQRKGRQRSQQVQRLANRKPHGDYGRQIRRDRRIRQQQICSRSTQRLHELGTHRYRYIRLCRRRLGLHLWGGCRMVPG